MKLQRHALGLLLAAALCAGGVYFYETRKPNPEAVNADGGAIAKLFPFKEEEIIFLTIQAGAQTIAIEKQNNKWQLSAPAKLPANEAVVAFLTNLLTTGNRDRVLTVPIDRKAEFGLDQPTGTIEITLNNQKKHRLVLGKMSFDRSSVYAQIDPDNNAKELQVSLLPPQFANAVDRKLAEWQEKTASPSPSPPK
jgi:hypothetical protein